MRKIWLRAPFLRIGIPFSSGIVFQLIWPVRPLLSTVILIICLIALIWSVRHRRMKSIQNRAWQGLVYAISFAGTGCWVGSMAHPAHHPFHYLFRNAQDSYYVLHVEKAPKTNAYYNSIECEVEQISPNGKDWLKACGKILVQFKTDSINSKIGISDRILIRVDTLKDHAPAPYIGAFDYGEYLRKKGVFKRVEIKEKQWQMLPEKNISWQQHFVLVRERITRLLDQYQVPPEQAGIIEALIWGKKDELDKELLGEFSKAGVVHILAVSGLHVGLVYVVISFIVFRVFHNNRSRWLRFVFTTLALWLYAALTGFSPSVMRASAMFTCLIIGEQFHQTRDSFNILAASAVFLMIIQPAVLTETGFHLSYLAVLGIMTLQKPLEKMLYFKNKSAQKIWSLSCVSLSAQLTTLPICLYLFHQFPTYFLISNLIVIPITTLILYFGLGFFAIAWFTPLGHLLINTTQSLVSVMIDFVRWMNQWPGALIDQIQITFLQSLLLFPILFFSFQYLFRKKKYALPFVFACCIGYTFCTFHNKLQVARQEHLQTHIYKQHFMATHVVQDQLHFYHFTETDTSTIPVEKYFGAMVNHYFTKPMVHHYFPDSISDILLQDQLRVHYFNPQEKIVPACDVLVFRQQWSKSYFTFDSIVPSAGRKIFFQGKWSRKKKEFITKTIQSNMM